MTSEAAIALGSNLGDREVNLQGALEELDRLDAFEPLSVSSIYHSEPWGDTDQPAFRNAVVAGRTKLPVRELLVAIQSIESRLGKQVVRKWGPRVIDLDLLFYGCETIAEPGLAVPHPRIQSRPFVYRPLRECLEQWAEAPREWTRHTHGNDEGRVIEGETRRLDPWGSWPTLLAPRESRRISRSEEETRLLGETLAAAAKPGDLFALVGPLGAGKSALARGIARGLEIAGPVPSPTYTLCREYPDARIAFHHWDFYRLQDADDLESTAFDDSLAAGAVLAVEWADLFPRELPRDRTTWIRIDRPEENMRRITLTIPPGALPIRQALAKAERLEC